MRRPAFTTMLRRLIRKRNTGEITPKEYAERRYRLVVTRIMYRQVKDERKRA
jgi:hypothetical protein